MMTARWTEAGLVVVSYGGRSGQNALELLEEIAEIRVISTRAGKFVDQIEGLPNSDRWCLILFVNGIQAEKGAEDVMTSDADVVEWRLVKLAGSSSSTAA